MDKNKDNLSVIFVFAFFTIFVILIFRSFQFFIDMDNKLDNINSNLSVLIEYQGLKNKESLENGR